MTEGADTISGANISRPMYICAISGSGVLYVIGMMLYRADEQGAAPSERAGCTLTAASIISKLFIGTRTPALELHQAGSSTWSGAGRMYLKKRRRIFNVRSVCTREWKGTLGTLGQQLKPVPSQSAWRTYFPTKRVANIDGGNALAQESHDSSRDRSQAQERTKVLCNLNTRACAV